MGFFLGLVDLVGECLQVEAFFGDACGFGAGGGFEREEFVVEAGEFGTFVQEVGQGCVVSVLERYKYLWGCLRDSYIPWLVFVLAAGPGSLLPAIAASLRLPRAALVPRLGHRQSALLPVLPLEAPFAAS